jgi:hypothetical protein
MGFLLSPGPIGVGILLHPWIDILGRELPRRGIFSAAQVTSSSRSKLTIPAPMQ